MVDLPTSGFLYPAFIDRGSDVNSLIYYTKNVKNPHPDIMENVLERSEKQTTAIIRDSFDAMVVNPLLLMKDSWYSWNFRKT